LIDILNQLIIVNLQLLYPQQLINIINQLIGYSYN